MEGEASPGTCRSPPEAGPRTQDASQLAADRPSLASRPFAAELSAGERQRVAVARALAGDPTVLLADEPTGSLDRDNTEGIYDLFSSFRDTGGTVVVVTHGDAASDRADRVVHLHAGRIRNDTR